MALAGKKLQTVDTMKVLVIDSNTKTPIMRGNTTKANFTNANDKIEINAGIGQERQCVLHTKKTTDIEFVVAEFDLEFMAKQNGVPLDKTSKGSYFFDQPVAIATASATVTGATRILAVRDIEGVFFKIITSGTPVAGEVKVSGDALTFITGYDKTSCYVTYEGNATKDVLTIKFNSKSFPQNVEFLGETVAYDQKTEAIIANVAANYYQCAFDGDYDWNFEMGTNMETTVKLNVLVPDYLPDGTINIARDTGKLTVTEI